MISAEQITKAFYQWEKYGRGYLTYSHPVDIEPPCFVPSLGESNDVIDDGIAKNIFARIGEALSLKKQDAPQVLQDVEVKTATDKSLVALKLNVPNRGLKTERALGSQFLTMLSFTNESVSFEWIANGGEIELQIVCDVSDVERIKTQIRAYYPEIGISDATIDINYLYEERIAVADFGYENEFICPIQGLADHHLDPMTSLAALFATLPEGEHIHVQSIFRGVHGAWSNLIPYMASDGSGGSLLADFQELPSLASKKVSQPLYAHVLRVACQGVSKERSAYLLGQVSQSFAAISTSTHNRLVPLSNEGYSLDHHLYALEKRQSFRLGMLCNLDELALITHIPDQNIQAKFGTNSARNTKAVPQTFTSGSTYFGENEHNGIIQPVYLNTQDRLRHCHIIGSTGSGKTTLLANLFIDDISQGLGALFLDPHGDAAEELLHRIPEHRKDDVIFFDPSDINHPMGFNLLEAKSEQEKMLLSSDLVSVFQREATSWGDVMTSVLSNAINAFVESNKGGTLFELKRFLLEKKFRDEFLKTVNDPATRYYFAHEFSTIKRSSLSPLLTRLDTFLRPKVLRNMFIQQNGLDFHEIVRENKILVVKLALGLIGERNASLLGSLIIAKMNQAAFARQSQQASDRTPYYLYLDEFHNVVTDSLESLLSGARKYSVGLVLAHQELSQIKHKSETVLQSVLNNAHIRVCFKTNENDAEIMSKSFGSFEASDIMNQGIGQAYIRVGASTNDFSLEVPWKQGDEQNSLVQHIKEQTRVQYCKSMEEIDALIATIYPDISLKKDTSEQPQVDVIEAVAVTADVTEEPTTIEPSENLSEKAQNYIQQEEKKERSREHQYLQTACQRFGHERGFKVELEKELDAGGRVDVHLENNERKIACEISVTNTVSYEVGNLNKCIDAGYDVVFCISSNTKHLRAIQTKAEELIQKEALKKVVFIDPKFLPQHLDALAFVEPKERVVRGYRVTVGYKVPK